MNIKKYEHRHLIRFLLLKFHNLSSRFPLYAQHTHKNCTENAHSNDFKCVLFEVPFGNTVVVDEPALCGVRPVSNVCIFVCWFNDRRATIWNETHKNCEKYCCVLLTSEQNYKTGSSEICVRSDCVHVSYSDALIDVHNNHTDTKKNPPFHARFLMFFFGSFLLIFHHNRH